MTDISKNQNTSDIVVDSLISWNVDAIFGIPGDGINGIIEALRRRKNKIRFILTRHEESAAFMACAYSKYTGKLGACVATTGPGATNLITGLYDAKFDNTSVIAITGSSYSDLVGSSYQQDIDLIKLMQDVSIYNNRINSPEHAKMVTDIACRNALVRKGVSHITIPIDVQEKKYTASFSHHKSGENTSSTLSGDSIPEHQSLLDAASLVSDSQKPVILVGQGALNAREEVIELSMKINAPIVKALLGKAVIPDDHPNNLGGLGMLGTEAASKAMSDTNLLIMIGTSFPYSEFLPDKNNTRCIQIDISPEKIGLRFPIDVGLVGDAKKTLQNLLPLLKENKSKEFLEKMQKEMRDWNDLMKTRADINSDPIKPQAVTKILSDLIEDDAIISVDSGTNTVWAARYIDLKKDMKFSVSGTLSSMACGLPYAIAAQIAYPKKQSIAFVGDGGLAMLMAEFSTAVKYKLPIKVFVIKNNTLGMIRWEQTAFLGNPEYGVEFEPIDFAKMAEACGGSGYTIQNSKEIESVIKTALKDTRPAIIEVSVDPFEAPMPPETQLSFVSNMLRSFVRGQPYKKDISLNMLKKKLKEM